MVLDIARSGGNGRNGCYGCYESAFLMMQHREENQDKLRRNNDSTRESFNRYSTHADRGALRWTLVGNELEKCSSGLFGTSERSARRTWDVSYELSESF